ncbi:MAG: glycosyltransferase family 2 protein [Phycisphaeraceae bacterium]
MFSIIIPAYNEADVIERCLRFLTQRPVDGGIEIIVACNGCKDNTAELARSFGTNVVVVETETASKIAALNLGDAHATSFPRIYLDADVVVDLDTIEVVANALRTERALAAAPKMHVDMSQSSWPVRAFYRIWLMQPYHQKGLIGGGFYAVSEAGRARFESFPRIIADDEFVRRHFQSSERINPPDQIFTIHAPRRFADLVKVKTRSRLGRVELAQKFPQLTSDSKEQSEGKRFDSKYTVGLWPAVCVYLLVNGLTRLRARRQLKQLGSYQWERDESSRVQAVEG